MTYRTTSGVLWGTHRSKTVILRNIRGCTIESSLKRLSNPAASIYRSVNVRFALGLGWRGKFRNSMMPVRWVVLEQQENK